VPTIRFEKEGQQVGCIEGANLRRAALDAGVNPYTGAPASSGSAAPQAAPAASGR
jgi:hypothetical protein